VTSRALSLMQRWAIGGLASEMASHEAGSAISAVTWAARGLKERHPDDSGIDRLAYEATKIGESLEFLTRFRMRNSSPTRARTIIECLKREYGRMGERLEIVVTPAFEQSDYYSNDKVVEAVFSNLVRNSVYWASADDRKAVVRLDAYRVEEPPIDPNGDEWEREPTFYTVLVVEDNGPGVDPALRETLFEPGETGRNSTGIGLYLCKSNLEANGDTILLDENRSDLGGARFLIGRKTKLRPEPWFPDEVAELTACADAMSELLRTGYGPEVLAMRETYAAIQSEALRVRLDGAMGRYDERLLAASDTLNALLAQQVPARKAEADGPQFRS
jgi:hypothetical protein